MTFLFIFYSVVRFYATAPVGVSSIEYQEQIRSFLWEYWVFVTDTQKNQCIGIKIFEQNKKLFQPWLHPQELLCIIISAWVQPWISNIPLPLGDLAVSHRYQEHKIYRMVIVMVIPIKPVTGLLYFCHALEYYYSINKTNQWLNCLCICI